MTPVLAFLGAMLGHVWSRRSAIELDRWRKREETMRMLRWACELAVDTDRARSSAGAGVLTALIDSPLIDPADAQFVADVGLIVAGDPIGIDSPRWDTDDTGGAP